MIDPEALRHEAPRQAELRLSEELERIAGVLAAAVRLGDGSEVRDVYIAAAEGTASGPIKEAAADVLRRAGLKANPGAVRVGAVASTASNSAATTPSPPQPWQGRFLILDGVEVQRSSSRVNCSVRLTRLEESFEGQAEELDTELGRARAGARAALAAAEKASPSALGLEGIQLPEIFGRRYVVVSVEATAARRYVVLSGILALDGARSLEEAAALAALRAIERFISW